MGRLSSILAFCFCLLILNSFGQAPPPPATPPPAKVRFVPDPGKDISIFINIKYSDLNLLNFALANAPLMTTETPANQLPGLNQKLRDWYDVIQKQVENWRLQDSVKSVKPPDPVKKK